MCSCNQAKTDQPVYVVTRLDGTTVEVKGEQQARIEVTKSGGGVYALKS